MMVYGACVSSMGVTKRGKSDQQGGVAQPNLRACKLHSGKRITLGPPKLERNGSYRVEHLNKEESKGRRETAAGDYTCLCLLGTEQWRTEGRYAY